MLKEIINLPVLFLNSCKIEMVMERTEIGLGSLYQKEPILLTGKNSRKIKGCEDFILEGDFENRRGRDKGILNCVFGYELDFF